MTDLERLRDAYTMQKYNCDKGGKLDAAGHPVQMRLTFDEWMQVWLDSGKLPLRGKGKGSFVMSRKNDLGSYEVGNVFIQSHADNIRDAQLGKKRTDATRAKMSAARKGKKRKDKPSDEYRAKMSAAIRGKKHTDAARANMSAAQKGRKVSDVARVKIGAILSKPCTVDGLTIYPSLTALRAVLGQGKAGTNSPNFRYVEKKSD